MFEYLLFPIYFSPIGNGSDVFPHFQPPRPHSTSPISSHDYGRGRTASSRRSRMPFGEPAIRSTVGNSPIALRTRKSSTRYGRILRRRDQRSAPPKIRVDGAPEHHVRPDGVAHEVDAARPREVLPHEVELVLHLRVQLEAV